METAVLIGVIVAAGLLMASGIWVGAVLAGTVTRVKRPAAPTTPGPASVVSPPNPERS